jgi:flagellar motor protein MotB
MSSGWRGTPPERWAVPVEGTRPADDDQTGWLITFSDLVLQLFAFVLVLTITRDPGEASAERGPADRRAASPVERAAILPAPPAPGLAAVGASLRDIARAYEHEGAVAVTVRSSEVVLSLAESIGFASGGAELLPAAVPILRRVQALARALPDLRIEVSGHTDDVPIHSGEFASNLELSLARAARVVEELAAGDPGLRARMVAAGYGDHRPVVANRDPSGRARNRRVDVRFVPLRRLAT